MTSQWGANKSNRFEQARAARIAAVQAFFQIETTQAEAKEVIKEFQEHRLPSSDYPYAPNGELFTGLAVAVYEHHEELQNLITCHLPEEWTFQALDPVVYATLMVGCSELVYQVAGLPAPVIISEYVDIGRHFCGRKEGGFINRLLDQIAHQLNLPMKSS